MKINLNPWALRLAQRFLDVEASGEVSILDGRTIEYAFTISKLMQEKEPKTLLDVGCVAKINLIPPLMAQAGWRVYGLDTRDYKFTHSNFTFLKEDILQMKVPVGKQSLDFATCISTLEHIGIKGRYGVETTVSDGDIIAVSRLKEALKTKGRLLVTLPYSKIARWSDQNRIYNKETVDKLFLGFKLLDKEVWAYKDTWEEVDEIEDLSEGLVLLEYEKTN